MEIWQIVTLILGYLCGGLGLSYFIYVKFVSKKNQQNQSIENKGNDNKNLQAGRDINYLSSPAPEKQKLQMRITASLDYYKSQNIHPSALTSFRDWDGKNVVVHPKIVEEEGIIEWLVSNTQGNWERYKTNFEPSIFSAEEV